MPINSRSKGARGEREWRDELRAQGYMKARRGQQFSGSPDSPDVVCPELEQFHFEVKRTEALNIYKAWEQASQDAAARNMVFASAGLGQPPKTPIVAHKRNHRPWLVIMSADTFFKMLRDSGCSPEIAAQREIIRKAHAILESNPAFALPEGELHETEPKA